MRVVFMGTPQIAADCLSRLIADGFDLVGVYTKPDMPKNRGMKLAMSEVKEVALAAGLPVYQPATFRDDAAVEELRALRPDVIAVVAYGKILPQRVLDIPKLGCINIHTSILPALRGSAPAQWAILNGLDETGVTAMYLSAGMDEGEIIELRKTPIEPLENSTALLARHRCAAAVRYAACHRGGYGDPHAAGSVQSNAGPDALEGAFAHRLDEVCPAHRRSGARA